jgi:hypothetical protein
MGGARLVIVAGVLVLAALIILAIIRRGRK